MPIMKMRGKRLAVTMDKMTRLLAVIGAMVLCMCAVGCADVNPFPSDSSAYTLQYRQGELRVLFNAEPAPFPREAATTDVIVTFHTRLVEDSARYDTACDYIDGDIRSGGSAECIVQVPNDLLPTDDASKKIIIWAHAENVNTMSGQINKDSPELSLRTVEPMDTDADGVNDDDDGCPDTPSGEAVEENGCPADPGACSDPSDTDCDGIDDLDASGAPNDAPSGGDLLGGGAAENDDGAESWGAAMDAGEGCALAGTAAANPAFALLLCGALLPFVTLRRR